MVERAKALAFAGGALVFPGGRVDPGDHVLATAPNTPDLDDAAARIAAIREMLEETGLAVGLSPPPSPEDAAAIRAGLHGDKPFAALIAAAGVTLDLPALVPFARWRPHQAMSRVFDARFYLARAPEHAQPQVDGTENVRLLWTSAAQALADADRGATNLIFPTRRNLERLALFTSFRDAVADADAHPITTIIPTVERRDGVDHLCIPQNLGYPVTAEPLARAMRG